VLGCTPSFRNGPRAVEPRVRVSEGNDAPPRVQASASRAPRWASNACGSTNELPVVTTARISSVLLGDHADRGPSDTGSAPDVRARARVTITTFQVRERAAERRDEGDR